MPRNSDWSVVWQEEQAAYRRDQFLRQNMETLVRSLDGRRGAYAVPIPGYITHDERRNQLAHLANSLQVQAAREAR